LRDGRGTGQAEAHKLGRDCLAGMGLVANKYVSIWRC
jgi:hypothetical protein